MKGSEKVRQINNRFKNESIIRTVLAVIGILCFSFSTSFGWGFILGGVITKENINLKTKEGWGLLAFTAVIMITVIYLLLDIPAVLGYIASTLLYFVFRELFNRYQTK